MLNVPPNAHRPFSNKRREPLTIVSKKSASSLFKVRKIASDGPHKLASSIAPTPRLSASRLTHARLINKRAKRSRSATRLLLKPIPVTRKKRYLAANHTKLRPTRASRRRRRPSNNVINSTPKVKVNLLPSSILKNQNLSIRPPIKIALNQAKQQNQIARSDFSSTNKSRKLWRYVSNSFHPRILPG